MAKTTTAQPTFTLEGLKALVDIPEARAMLASILRETRQEADRADATAAIEAATIKAFARQGFKNVQPRIDVLVYHKWVEQGRKVKEGEKAIKVKNLRLFHISQTEPISKKDQAEYLAKRAAKTSDRLPRPSPVEPRIALSADEAKRLLAEERAAKPAKGRKSAPQQPAA